MEIGYFLKKIDDTYNLSWELINTALISTAEAEKVCFLIYDGNNTNNVALNKLGCNIFVNKFKYIKNYFAHLALPYNVYVLLDPCQHVKKLARNALDDYKKFYSTDGIIQ